MLVSSKFHPKTLDFFQKTSDIILISWEVFSNTSDIISRQCDKQLFSSLMPLKSMPWESHNRPQRETIFIDRVKFDVSQRKHFKIIAIQQSNTFPNRIRLKSNDGLQPYCTSKKRITLGGGRECDSCYRDRLCKCSHPISHTRRNDWGQRFKPKKFSQQRYSILC